VSGSSIPLGTVDVRLVRERVTSRVAVSLGGSAATQLLGVITGILLARGLAPEGRGALAAMVLWPTVVVMVGDLGLGNAFAYFSARQPQAARSMMATACRSALIWSAFLAPLGAGVSWIALHAAGVHDVGLGVLLAVTFIPAALLSRFIAGVLQGQSMFGRFYAVRLSMSAGIALVLVGLFLTSSLTLASAVGAYLFGLAAMSVLSLALVVWFRRTRRDGESPEAPHRHELLRYGLRSLPGSLYPVEALFLDQMLVVLFLGPRELGLYVAALAFTSLVRLMAHAIGTAALPAVAAQHATRDQKATGNRYLLLALTLLTPIALGLCAALGILVPALFGKEFQDAVAPATWLVMGSLLFGLRRVLGDVLRGRGFPGLVSVVEMGSWPLLVAAAAVGASRSLEGVTIGLLLVQALALAALWVGQALRIRVEPVGGREESPAL